MSETKTSKITKIEKLIEGVEKVHQFTPGNYKQLTKVDKIMFAYDFYNITEGDSLLNILINLPEENETLRKLIKKFMVEYKLLKPYPNTSHYTNPLAQNTFDQLRLHGMPNKNIIREYNYQNWLELFDENAMFEETKTKHPSYRIYIGLDGQPIKFDKELSAKVKAAIIEQGIAPARCIVEGAYPYVAKETLEEYTYKIKNKQL